MRHESEIDFQRPRKTGEIKKKATVKAEKSGDHQRITRSILDGYLNPRDYLCSPAKNLSFCAGYLRWTMIMGSSYSVSF